MLTTYSPQFDYSAIDRADLQPSTRTKYKAAIRRLIDAQVDPFNALQLAEYASTLPHSSRAFLKSALSLMATEYERLAKSSATVERVGQIQAALWKLEAMDKAIVIHTPEGKASSIWLSSTQIEQITSLPDSTLAGRRDWIVLAVLLGAGLRRSELAELTFDMMKRQPMKDGQIRTVLDITGKGNKKRVIPISPLLEKKLTEWLAEIGPGKVVRAVNKSGVMNGSLSDKSIGQLAHKYGAMIGIPELEAHDLRRTWAQIGLNAGIPITQISTLLGHSSVTITQKYLDMQTDLDRTISDFIPLSGV
jgi:site-specific recombinase XerD